MVLYEAGVDVLDQDVEEDLVSDGDVNFGEYPFVVAIFNALKKLQTCTGAIVNEKVVLAAEYCVMDHKSKIVDPVFISVLGGVVDMRDHIRDQWRYAVKIVGKENRGSEGKSLMLIMLNAPFYINYNTQTTKVLVRSSDMTGDCVAVTWRFREKLNRLTLASNVLNHYSIRMINNSDCRSSGILDDESQYLCGTIKSSGKYQSTECANVDGGLVLCESFGVLYPSGIATDFFGGSSCRRSHSSFTFHDIGNSLDWISEQVEEMITERSSASD